MEFLNGLLGAEKTVIPSTGISNHTCDELATLINDCVGGESLHRHTNLNSKLFDITVLEFPQQRTHPLKIFLSESRVFTANLRWSMCRYIVYR